MTNSSVLQISLRGFILILSSHFVCFQALAAEPLQCLKIAEEARQQKEKLSTSQDTGIQSFLNSLPSHQANIQLEAEPLEENKLIDFKKNLKPDEVLKKALSRLEKTAAEGSGKRWLGSFGTSDLKMAYYEQGTAHCSGNFVFFEMKKSGEAHWVVPPTEIKNSDDSEGVFCWTNTVFAGEFDHNPAFFCH